ncbi:endonuclease/exonuclease/phosphatase family protein [Victivallis sp. Marseille-Q1083]|uniref:endonuclease/exonuclease/phosphatase family protein n=1 Tax=Victivallis sp. Marseille-Q1083 TaxID=2717288 RepID=UPI00158E1808|nr:endonuclease/exonuclease/phosphatase family protein [Victivallis sp. Marseille-Q1083]
MKRLGKFCLLPGLVSAGVLIGGCGTAAPQEIKIMTYNIHAGIGMDDQFNLPRLAEVIRANGADVIGLEEVDINNPRSQRSDIPRELGQLLNMHPAFIKAVAFHEGTSQYGNAVLSKYPLEVVDKLPLPGDGNAEPRAALVVKVAAEQPFYFIVTHFVWEPELEDLRLQSVDAIDQLVQSKKYYPAILVGDLNQEPDAACIEALRKNWTLTNDHGGSKSWPADQPEQQLDYIAFTPKNAFEIVRHQVIGEVMASDHRPVMATLRRTPQP